MADLKISALTASTTPLAGTEVLPIVQSGTTKQVSVANLTAGRAVSALSVTATSAATDFTNIDITNTSTGGVAYRLASGGQFGYFDIPTGAFAVRDVSNSATRAYWTTGGNQVLPNGNLVIGTSGKGIDFSATPGTGTSELLADYEEGDWTPSDGSGAGLVFTGVVGRYTKIGQVVTYFGDVTYPATANASGMIITGLPFTSNSALNRTGSVISTTVNAVGAVVPPSTTSVLVFPAGSLTPPTNATLSTARLIFAGSYQV